MSKPTDKGRAFVARLETLVEREDRGALAALRRGLGKPPGTVPEMCPLVEPWLSGDPDPWRDDPYYIVAALFAFWHQGARAAAAEAGPPRSLGASERRLGFDEDGKWSEDRFKGVERRFVALLNCHRDDLHVHLRRRAAKREQHQYEDGQRNFHLNVDNLNGRAREATVK